MAEKGRMFGKRAEEAESTIARAEAVLNVLRLSKADISSAARLVAAAREAVRRKEYESAHSLAARAESLASSLEERYKGAQQALSALRGIAKKARELGTDASGLEARLAEARRVAREGTVENGIAIPNYLQARAILETALDRGRDLLKQAEAATNEIFTAELALDALKDANGHMDHEEFERVVLSGARALLEGAKRDLAAGRADEAEAVARKAEGAAKKILQAHEGAVAALRDAEKRISEQRAAGRAVAGPEKLLEQGRILLRRAKIGEAKEAFEKADREAQRAEIDLEHATKAVKEAEDSLASLARSGFLPEEAQHALRDAKQVLAEGRYERAEELAAEARRALGKRQEIRERLARTIEETKRKVEELRAIGTDYANDVEEMLLRAEREFENGDFVTSSEDLKIASLLIGPRSAPHKGRPTPAGNP